MINQPNNKPDTSDKAAQKTTQPDPNDAANKDGGTEGAKKNTPPNLKGLAAVNAKEQEIKDNRAV